MNLPPLYALTTLAAMLLSGLLWWRLARKDSHLFLLYLGALFGALVGAKMGWFVAEGWRDLRAPYFWLMFATGKTILGGLLGGFLAVEWLKRLLDVRRRTGDWFATVVPLGIAIGRIGCIREGCCLGVPWDGWCAAKDVHGVPRWPSAQLELAFNLLAAGVFFVLRRKRVLPGQHFHLYLIAYGLFRFFHEFARDTPREVGAFSGYQVLALACVFVGVVGFVLRSRSFHPPST